MLSGAGGRRLGDSLAVELPALTRAALVRIQVPQPDNILILQDFIDFRKAARTPAKTGLFQSPGRASARRDTFHTAITRRRRPRLCEALFRYRLPRLSGSATCTLLSGILKSSRCIGAEEPVLFRAFVRAFSGSRDASLCLPVDRDPSDAGEFVRRQRRGLMSPQDGVCDIGSEPRQP